MMDEKYLNNLPPDLDKENVKTNLQEFFKNPNLLGELYKNLSLSDTDILIYLERLSHYCTAKKLYQLIPNVDKFASSTKTINSCFKGKYDDALFLYMALLPSMFSSFKELYMGKTSRKNWLNKLNDEDLQELGNITVNPNNLSKKQIITEIRNALNHTHYVPGKEELYIKNPQNADPRKHAQDFEADVPYIFLVHFILLTRLYSRKIDYYGLKIDDQKLLYDLRENESNIKYEDVKDKIHFFKGVSKEKHGNGVYEDSSDSIDMKEIARSEQAENIISKYFSNNKLNKRSLCYVAECLARPPELYMREIFMALVFNQIDGIHKYKGLNSPELTLDVYQNMKNKKYFGFSNEFDAIESDEGKEMLISLFKELEKKHQSNGQSILKHFEGCVNFAKEYLKKHGFSVDIQWKYEPNGESILKYFDIGSSNDYLKKGAIPVAYYKKGDITIDLESICNGIFSVCTQYYIVNEMVQAFPNWLRTQLIKMVYVNEQVSLQDENVEGLISKVDTSINENGVGKKPTRERIRDALSHHTSTQFNGIDEIVLRDGYDKKTDSWAREATFSLSQLFESTFRDLDENSIASSYSFLLEFLKNIDN